MLLKANGLCNNSAKLVSGFGSRTYQLHVLCPGRSWYVIENKSGAKKPSEAGKLLSINEVSDLEKEEKLNWWPGFQLRRRYPSGCRFRRTVLGGRLRAGWAQESSRPQVSISRSQLEALR